MTNEVQISRHQQQLIHTRNWALRNLNLNRSHVLMISLHLLRCEWELGQNVSMRGHAMFCAVLDPVGDSKIYPGGRYLPFSWGRASSRR